MTSKIVVNNIEADAGISTVTFASNIQGNLIGNVTGNVTGTVNSSGIATFTSGIVVSAGSTSAPSITPTGDSNTGIFFPSPDTVCIGEGGVEALRLDSGGRVTMPYQPGFLVTGSFTSTSGATVNSFSIIGYNIGNHYNNSTGQFTCPIAGKYLATASFLANTANNFTLFNFFNNGNVCTSNWHQGYNYSQTGGQCITASMVISASANDILDVRFNSAYNNAYTLGYAYMSINLIG